MLSDAPGSILLGTTGLEIFFQPGITAYEPTVLVAGVLIDRHWQGDKRLRTVAFSLEGMKELHRNALPALMRLQEKMYGLGVDFGLCRVPAHIAEFLAARRKKKRFRIFTDEELEAIAAQ